MKKHKIDDATMEKVEILSKLALTEEERERAREEMEKILTYVDQMNGLDTDSEEPLVHILETVNVFREDQVTNPDGRGQALLNAPEEKDGQYKVPKTV